MNTSLFNKVDFIIVPIILLLIVLLLNRFKKKQPLNLQPFFFKGFYLRVLGTITISIVYQFIYGYGDTFAYYQITQAISSFFLKNPGEWVDIILNKTNGENASVLKCLELIESVNPISGIIFKIPENVAICKLASVFNLICFNSYIGIALFFGTLSFLGCWYIFKTFVYIYPGYEKQFALLCLYLPSLWFWGNGILKDPVCIFGLGLLVYNFFIKRGSILKRIVLISISIFILLQIKSYIFYAFAIAAMLGLIITYFRKLGIIGKVFLILFTILLLILIFSFLSEYITQSFLDITSQSQFFIDQYANNVAEGDSTVIPKFDPSVFGFFKLCFQGLITVFLRPFPWELNKILYVLLIVENVLLYVIIFRKLKTGPIEFKKNHKYLTNFSFFFFIFLGIIIGVTAFNLGTTARYRVPALPFLFAGVFSLKLLIKKKRLEKGNYTVQLDNVDKSSKGLASP